MPPNNMFYLYSPKEIWICRKNFHLSFKEFVQVRSSINISSTRHIISNHDDKCNVNINNKYKVTITNYTSSKIHSFFNNIQCGCLESQIYFIINKCFHQLQGLVHKFQELNILEVHKFTTNIKAMIDRVTCSMKNSTSI